LGAEAPESPDAAEFTSEARKLVGFGSGSPGTAAREEENPLQSFPVACAIIDCMLTRIQLKWVPYS